MGILTLHHHSQIALLDHALADEEMELEHMWKRMLWMDGRDHEPRARNHCVLDGIPSTDETIDTPHQLIVLSVCLSLVSFSCSGTMICSSALWLTDNFHAYMSQ